MVYRQSVHAVQSKGGIRVNVTLQQRAVRMARFVGTATQQAVTEATLDLPGSLPDMSRIVQVTAKPLITGWEAADNEIVVQGTVDFVVVYAHEREEAVTARDIEAEHGYEVEAEEIMPSYASPERTEELYRYRWRRGGSFELALDVAGAHPGVVAHLQAYPEEMDVQLHHTGRGLDVEAVVSVTARVSELEEAVVSVKGDVFPDDVDAHVEQVAVRHAGARDETHLSVEGALPYVGDVPLARIIDVVATAQATAEVAEDGKVAVSGSVDYRTVGIDENGDLRKLEWQGQTPFTYTFAMDGVSAGAKVDVVADVTGVDAAVTDGGRQMEVFADVHVGAEFAELQRLPLLVGMSGPEGTEVRFRTATFGLEEWVGHGTADDRLRHMLELPPGHPPIDRIVTTEAHAVIEDVLVLGDKVIAEGYVDISALYIARTEGQPVHYVSWRRAVPIESEIGVEGAQPGMDAAVTARVGSVELDLLNRETVEADVRITVDVDLSRPVEREAVVEAVAVPPIEENPPTLTFVVIQPGDTLWKLSHRYHSDVAQIVRANPWLEGAEDEPLPLGRKLCVPRRRPEAPVTT